MIDDRQARELAEAVLRQFEGDSRLATRLRAILLGKQAQKKGQGERRPHRRHPGVFDPFEIYSASGEDALRTHLHELELDQLKDIVAEHAIDLGPRPARADDPARPDAATPIDRVGRHDRGGDCGRQPESIALANRAAGRLFGFQRPRRKAGALEVIRNHAVHDAVTATATNQPERVETRSNIQFHALCADLRTPHPLARSGAATRSGAPRRPRAAAAWSSLPGRRTGDARHD